MTDIPEGTEEGATQALANFQRSETEMPGVYRHHTVNYPLGYQDLYLTRDCTPSTRAGKSIQAVLHS